MDDGIAGKFRSDSVCVDVGTLAELQYDTGISFSDRKSRNEFFARARQDPNQVRYGAALSHAASVNLGWGNRQNLYLDCAEIMTYELQRLQVQMGQVPSVTIAQVMMSPSFLQAYRMARPPKESAFHNLVRLLGGNSKHMEMKSKDLGARLIQLFPRLHQTVLSEIAE